MQIAYVALRGKLVMLAAFLSAASLVAALGDCRPAQAQTPTPTESIRVAGDGERGQTKKPIASEIELTQEPLLK